MKLGKNISRIIKALLVFGVLALIGRGLDEVHTWEVGDLMDRYKVRQNFPDPAGQRLIALVIANKTDEALAFAQTVPGGVNAAGTDGLTPLIVALWQRNPPMVKALLKAGADPNGNSKMLPLTMAARAEDPTMLRMLLDAGADPNGTPGSTPSLLEAAELDHHEDVELLLKAGARIDEADALGYTPAIEAALAGNFRMVVYLLDHGASVWATSNGGITIASNMVNIAPTDPEVIKANAEIIERLKAAGWPWPPPSPNEVEKLMGEGKWPPKEAQGH